ncbi:hypothetical protein JCGZ_13159 [Jatropha curcas]|uniref:UvrD-like helicase ATP-binding domain-containing protein n=1 Tax=Jatropha curcas TaxID=180498 RepID=A0A067KLC8_JATCU|nr:hypothetical protein JCGZ_13159 [Jatropha curcas]
MTKKLDSSRVFTEIMSHIKGGLQSGESCDGRLARKDYVTRSEGRLSTLSREKREMIYDIYEDYEKMKIANGDFDTADFVIDLHLRLSNGKYEGDIMDFVYIDEVQDLTMRQIALFKHICRNVTEGFIFSGDTAQTIARGIDFRTLDDSLAQAMQVSSSPEEWKSRGYKLLREGNYEMATMCFERAGDTYGEKVAKAAGLKATADRMHASNPEEASVARGQAAEIFESIGKVVLAAECFFILKQYEWAGQIYLQCGESAIERAGECFSLAGCYKLAAEVYATGNHFSECLSACLKGELFDMGLQYIQCWKQVTADQYMVKRSQEMAKIEQEFLEKCALHYHKLNDNRAMMRYVRTFDSMDSIRTFLNALECLDELLSLEEESGNFMEAAKIAKLKGDNKARNIVQIKMMEVQTSSKNRGIPDDCDFITTMFSWSLEDIYNDQLFKVEENCSLCSMQNNGTWDENIVMNLSSTLNESQTEAILACLCRTQCNHRSAVELIWGPPGTGKTKTISMFLFTLLRVKCRVLICAPTNVAVTELASRVLKLVTESSETDSATDALFCSVGNILLFGHKDRLKVNSDIEDIYLDYRVKRLTECFAPSTGWRYCFTATINFFEDCVCQYYIFLQNELIKEQDYDQENKKKDESCSNGADVCSGKHKSFLEFMRERFCSTVSQLKRCVLTLCTHIPESYILKHNIQSVKTLVILLGSFENLLFRDDVSSEELEKLFAQEELDGDSSEYFADISLQLYLHRTKCLSTLETLYSSFSELELPSGMSKYSIEEFCFQTASLIFCTASSSYKLYSLDSLAMQPLNLLVIDEAAQLKECESIIPLQLPGIKHAILIGDECQLPATVESNLAYEAGFGRSLFERLSFLGHPKHLLKMQYRMHPSISSFPNSNFYSNKIIDAPNVKIRSYEKCYLPGPMFGPYSFINVNGGREEVDDVGRSQRNMAEAAVVLKLIHCLYKAWNGLKQNLSIGVISPYAAQVVAIQDKLSSKYEKVDGFSVKVQSIDGFQGGEEDIVIISTVRSNSSGELAKAILDVKKEFDQLDDLLNGNSVLFKCARWKVLFSEYFRRSFGKLRAKRTKTSVLNLLLRLSSGWRPKKRNVDLTCESSSQILKQFKVEELYVICSVDIVKEVKYIQVLKVWDILPLEDIPSLVKRLSGIFERHTDDFISRCNAKCLEGDLEVPKVWSTSFDIVRYKSPINNEAGNDSNFGASDSRCYVENSKVSDSLLLMKFYSLSSGVVKHLLSDRDGKELELPFEVTDEELEVIVFQRTTFILGRSGTGKTTVLTMKLFQKEQQFHMATEGFGEDIGNLSKDACWRNNVSDEKKVEDSVREDNKNVLHQLFVTVSSTLCYAVKHHVSQLKSFASGGKYMAESNSVDMEDIDGIAQFKDIPDSFIDIPSNLYPLTITFHKFLMMLDGTIGNSYFERFPDVRQFLHEKMGSLESNLQEKIMLLVLRVVCRL